MGPENPHVGQSDATTVHPSGVPIFRVNPTPLLHSVTRFWFRSNRVHCMAMKVHHLDPFPTPDDGKKPASWPRFTSHPYISTKPPKHFRSAPSGHQCTLFGFPLSAMPTMDSTQSPSQVPPSSPVNTATSSADIARIKATLDGIEERRNDAIRAMSAWMHRHVVEYLRTDRSFVDEYTACLNDLLARFPDEAVMLDWAKPCLGVPDRESFVHADFTIKFHPSDDPGGHLPQVRHLSPSPSSPQPLSLWPDQDTISSMLSSAPSSPGLESGLPASNQVPDHESADALAFDTQPPPRQKPKKRPRPLPDAPATGTGTGTGRGRKPLSTSRRGQNTTTGTVQQPATAATQSTLLPPHPRKSHVPCTECTRRKQRCNRKLPCSMCLWRDTIEECRYPSQPSKK